MPTTLPFRSRAVVENDDQVGNDWVIVLGHVTVIIVLLAGLLGAVWGRAAAAVRPD